MAIAVPFIPLSLHRRYLPGLFGVNLPVSPQERASILGAHMFARDGALMIMGVYVRPLLVGELQHQSDLEPSPDFTLVGYLMPGRVLWSGVLAHFRHEEVQEIESQAVISWITIAEQVFTSFQVARTRVLNQLTQGEFA